MKIRTIFISGIITILLLQITTNKLFAQKDSVNISYSIENADSSNYNYQRQYQYLDFAQINEKNLIKGGVSAFKSNNQLYLAYERKVLKSLSVSIELSNERWEPDRRIGIKYYFLMNKRIKQGLSGNNLSGLYVGSRINFTHFDNEKNSNFILADASIGLQKRLNWFTFIDVNLFLGTTDHPGYENYGYVFGLNGKIGLAWGWGK